MKINLTWLVVGLAVIFLLLLSSVFIVREGHTAIKTRVGEITANDIEPGLHFKIPGIESVIRFDARLQTLDAPSEAFFTAEKKELIVDYFIEWRIVDTQKYWVATRGAKPRAESIIEQIANNQLRGEFARRTVKEVVAGDREEIMQSITDTLSGEVGSQGMQVVDVRVKRVEFSDQIKGNIFDRMRAERERVSNSIRAEGREREVIIRAQTDREANIILANANRDAQIIRGQGDAEATKVYADSFSQDESFYRFQKSLEAYQAAFNNKSDTFITSPDSEFFNFLKNKE